jgi:hypothetical protein
MMRRQSTMRAALGRLWRSERGFALPTVLMIIIAALGLSGAAVVASVHTQSGSVRDEDSKDALAAADAGVQLALYRQNKIATSSVLPCVVPGSGGDLVPGSALADGWCPAWTGTVGGRSYTYRVKPWSLVGTTQTGVKRQLSVVSVGSADNVSRRVDVVATAKDGSGVFGDFSAVGIDGVTINGNSNIGNSTTTTNAATNGSITTLGSGYLCGDAKHGLGQAFSGTQCPGYQVFEEELSMPPVDPGTAWTTNSNGRFFAQDPKKGNVTWDATTRTLTMTGGGRVTLGASIAPYSFCQLNMSGSSQLIVAQGAVVSIIFHSPETCGQTGNPVTQVNMTGNTELVTTSGNPYDLRIVMAGSESIPTKAHFIGNSGSEMTVYAPQTDVELWGSTTYYGAVAGKTLTLGGNAKFLNDDRAAQAQLPISIVYHRDRYVECTGGAMPAAAGTHPDDYC